MSFAVKPDNNTDTSTERQPDQVARRHKRVRVVCKCGRPTALTASLYLHAHAPADGNGGRRCAYSGSRVRAMHPSGELFIRWVGEIIVLSRVAEVAP
jgi:hypothetical protein